ncbi:MAG: glycosyltransferase family 4 protein [Candidatus Faecivicinus sp.]
MKILITTDLFSAPANGVVTSINNLREELTKKGHDVRVLTLSGDRHSHREGAVYLIKSVSLDFIYPAVRMPVSYRNALIREIMDWKPDIIHSQCEFFSYQFALHIGKVLNIPIVHTYHTLYEQYVSYVIPNRRLGCFLVRVLSRRRLKRVARIIAPTQKVEQTLRSYGLTDPISIVPSGIALEQHKKRLTEAERAQKKRELGIPEESQVLISLGRLGVEKNLEELLKLFAEELTCNGKLTLLIVGDGPARTELEKLADRLAIADHVIFTGMVSPCQVQQYYQLGDIFVCASTSETQGLTYIEAAANGLPLLCRRDPCLNGVIVDGKNGYVYTLSGEFHEKINAMLSDAGWRKRAGEYSEQIAESFDKCRFAAAIEEVYRSVLR